MSLEAAAIIFALLWGPTALWLIFRAVRGPKDRSIDSFGGESAPPRSSQPPLDAVIHGEYWICTECRSVNHVGAMRCYSCGVEPVEPAAPVSPEQLPPGNGWVPAIDPPAGSTSVEPATAPVLPVSSDEPESPVDAPPADPATVPVAPAAAAGSTKRPRAPRRPRAGAERATVPDVSVAAHMTEAPAADGAAAAPPPAPAVPLAALPSAPPMCPYLGFKDDRATRSSYPDDRNVCHAAAAAGASASNPGRLMRGVRRRGRAVSVSLDHQASLCLTSEHQQCRLYPAGQPAARPS